MKFRVEMTTAIGEILNFGKVFDTRAEAETWMNEAREDGMFTDGRDAYGNLYAPNRVQVVDAR